MFGNVQVQKLGLNLNGTTGQAATGWYRSAGFIADGRSPNAAGGLFDALSVSVPNSGESSELKNFSVIGSGTIANGSGNWIFNLCVCEPLPAVTAGIQSKYIYNKAPYAGAPVGYAYTSYGGSQALPQPSASSGIVALTVETSFVIEADITVSAGVLTGTWTLSLNGIQTATGDLINLPTNLSQPIAAYLQIAAQPPSSSISNLVLAVSVSGYNGAPATLNL